MRERRQQNRRMPTRGRDDDGGGGAKGRRCGQWIGRDESHRDKEREREEGALRIRENNTTWGLLFNFRSQPSFFYLMVDKYSDHCHIINSFSIYI